MTKAEEILETILHFIDFKIAYPNKTYLIQDIQEIMDRKCTHPIEKISPMINCHGWKCNGCDQKVVATKFEVVE